MPLTLTKPHSEELKLCREIDRLELESNSSVAGLCPASIAYSEFGKREYNSQNQRPLPPGLGGKFSVINKVFKSANSLQRIIHTDKYDPHKLIYI